MPTFHTPDWVKDAVFYQIFPDRFARSDRIAKPSHLESWDAPPTYHGFKGGDLLGIVEHLDYLEALGVTALYLNPIFQSAANHRYHTFDYCRVDPLLGGNEAFETLLTAAHDRGIRIVLDGVFNHASRGFFQFNHILENGQASPYLDWFRIYGFPLNAYVENRPPNYAAWWNLHALPQFNHDNPDVREFLWRVGERWVKKGVDGWRLDVPNEISTPGFWEEFRRRVKVVNPEAYLVGEIWGDARTWLNGDRFDGVMNYLFTKACIEFFAGSHLNQALVEGVGYAPVSAIDASEFAQQIEALLRRYPRDATLAQLNLLDSHDTARFRTIAYNNRSAHHQAVLFQMFFVGAPCIYYGDEIGMEGKKDPDSRRAFPWNDRDRWDTETLDWYKRSIALRHQYRVLRRGEFEVLYAKGDVFVCARYDSESAFVVGFNRGGKTAQPAIKLGGVVPAGTPLFDVLAGKKAYPPPADSALDLMVPAEGVRILRAEPAAGPSKK